MCLAKKITPKDQSWYRDPLPRLFGLIQRQVWVFEIIGEVKKRCKLFIVEARNAEQLGAIVAAHIRQGRKK